MRDLPGLMVAALELVRSNQYLQVSKIRQEKLMMNAYWERNIGNIN